MKNYLLVLLALPMLMTFSIATAEAVDAVPAPLLAEAKFFDAAVLGTFADAAAAAEMLVLLIKWLFGLQGDAMRLAVVACSILAVATGRFYRGDDITLANMLLTILNGGVVAATLMKLYEVTDRRFRE